MNDRPSVPCATIVLQTRLLYLAAARACRYFSSVDLKHRDVPVCTSTVHIRCRLSSRSDLERDRRGEIAEKTCWSRSAHPSQGYPTATVTSRGKTLTFTFLCSVWNYIYDTHTNSRESLAELGPFMADVCIRRGGADPRARARARAHAAAHALNYRWKFMRACYGSCNAYEKQCAGESLSGTARECKSQLSHFRETKGFAEDTRRKIFSVLTLFFTASVCEGKAWNFISFPKLTREKEKRDTLIAPFNKSTGCYCCERAIRAVIFCSLIDSLSFSLFRSKYGRKDVETCRKFSTHVLYTRSVRWPEWKNATRLSC